MVPVVTSASWARSSCVVPRLAAKLADRFAEGGLRLV